jgi:TP901 family phage tail tape measure protein
MAKTLIEIRAETSQYQQAMRQAAAEMKNLTAQHSLAAAQAKLSGSAQDALRARVTELTSKIDVQKGIVQQNGQQYDNLKQKLELQKTAHDQLKTKVEAAKKAYEDSAKATGEDSEETQKLKAEYEKLSSQLSTSESQITKTETAITKQEAAVNQSKAALTEMEAELKNVNAELARAPFDGYAAKAEKVGGTLTSVGQKLLPLSTSIAGLGVAAVKTTADFDSEMSKVSAISGATGTDLDKLRGKAREMGAKTKFSASEAAQGMQYMAMAGWKTQDMMDGLEGIMNLAAASGEDLASTSDIVTDALTAFGLSAKDSSHFSDILAAASSNANTNVSMMGETFKYAAPVLGSLGYTAEDAALAIGLMANAGIKSSQAGTSLRGAITNLAKPTDTVAAAMDKYGISLTDSSGKMLSLRELMEQLRQKLGGLSEAEQAQAAAALFGKNAMSGMLAIINGSDKDFEKLAGAIDNCDGSSEKMANTMNDNLQGQITILMSQLQELAISFGEILMPKIRDIVTHIQNFVDKLNAMDEGQKETILRIGMFVAALAPMLMGLGKVITFTRALGTLSAGLVKAGGFSGVFTKALGLITSPAAIVVGAIAAITAVIIHLWNTNEDFRNTITAIWQKIKDAFTTFAAGISERLSALGITFSDVTSAIKTIWDGFCNLLAPVLEAAFNTIAIALQTAFNVILGIWDVFSAVFSGDWSGAWEAVKGIFSSVWDGLKEYFSTIIGAVKGVADVFLGWFGTNWETVWNGVKTFFEGIWNGISTFCTTVWNGIVTNVTAFCTTVHDTISTIFNAVKDVVSNVWETIKNVVQVAIMFIVEVIKAAFELITVPFRFIWENCRDTIISVWETIKSAVQTAINFVKDNIITPVMNAISTTITTVWNAIQTTFTTVINAIKSAVQTAWNFMKDNVITPVMNAISTTITTVWNTIKTTFTTVINAIKSAVQTAWNFMKDSVITPVMNGIKTVITTVWNAIKTAVQTVVNAIKTTVQTVFNAVKTTVTTIWNAIKTGTSTAWNAVKTAVTTPINAAKSAVTSAINGIKSTISSVWNSVKSATSSTWNAIKTAITTPINAAKTAVGNAISAIRSKFNFSWSLPHLKLPHPSISGSFSLNPPSVPHFSISWYKNGGIMTKPTAFGAAGDTLLAGGEAGAEAILPLKQFYDRLGDMLDKKLDAIMTGTTVYVYVTMDGEVVATKVYSKVEEKFTNEIKRRR